MPSSRKLSEGSPAAVTSNSSSSRRESDRSIASRVTGAVPKGNEIVSRVTGVGRKGCDIGRVIGAVRKSGDGGHVATENRRFSAPTVARTKPNEPPRRCSAGNADAVAPQAKRKHSKGENEAMASPAKPFRQNMARRHVFSKAKVILAAKKAATDDDESSKLALSEVVQAVVQGTKENLVTEKMASVFTMSHEERLLREQIKERAREALKDDRPEAFDEMLKDLEKHSYDLEAKHNGYVDLRHVTAELEVLGDAYRRRGDCARQETELCFRVTTCDASSEEKATEKHQLLLQWAEALEQVQSSEKEFWDLATPLLIPESAEDPSYEEAVAKLSKLPEASLELLKQSVLLSCDSLTAEIFKEECGTIIGELGVLAEDIPKIVDSLSSMGWRDHIKATLDEVEEKTRLAGESIRSTRQELEHEYPEMFMYPSEMVRQFSQELSHKTSRASSRLSASSSPLGKYLSSPRGTYDSCKSPSSPRETFESSGPVSVRSGRISKCRITASASPPGWKPKFASNDSLLSVGSSKLNASQRSLPRGVPRVGTRSCSPLSPTSALISDSLNITVKRILEQTGSDRLEESSRLGIDPKLEQFVVEENGGRCSAFSTEIVYDVEGEECDDEKPRTLRTTKPLLSGAVNLSGWDPREFHSSQTNQEKSQELRDQSNVEPAVVISLRSTGSNGGDDEDIPERIGEDEERQSQQFLEVCLPLKDSPSFALKMALRGLRQDLIDTWGSIEEAFDNIATASTPDKPHVISLSTFVDALQASGYACAFGEVQALMQALSIVTSCEGNVCEGVFSKDGFMRLNDVEADFDNDVDGENIKQVHDAFRKHQFHRLMVGSLSMPEQMIAEMHIAAKDWPTLAANLDKCFEELSGPKKYEFAEFVLSTRGISALVEILGKECIRTDLRIRIVSLLSLAVETCGGASFSTVPRVLVPERMVSENWLASYRVLSDVARVDRYKKPHDYGCSEATLTQANRVRVPTPPTYENTNTDNDFQARVVKHVWRPILDCIDPDTEPLGALEEMLFVQILALMQQMRVPFVVAGAAGEQIVSQVSAALHRLQDYEQSQVDVQKVLAAFDNLCGCVSRLVVSRVVAALGGRRVLRERIATFQHCDAKLEERAGTFLFGVESERRRIDLRWPTPVSKPLERAKFDAIVKAKEIIADASMTGSSDELPQQPPRTLVEGVPPKTAALRPSPVSVLQGWRLGFEENLIRWMNGKTTSVSGYHYQNRTGRSTKSCRLPRITDRAS